jgi:hypothetical protein
MMTEGALILYRAFLLLSLAATLSGPFLRQSEGAEDLVRSLGELGCPPLVEETDGGIGDDSGAAVLSTAKGMAIEARFRGNQAPFIIDAAFLPGLGWGWGSLCPAGQHGSWIGQRGSAVLRSGWLQRLLC